jgi:hypothetical protein
MFAASDAEREARVLLLTLRDASPKTEREVLTLLVV